MRALSVLLLLLAACGDDATPIDAGRAAPDAATPDAATPDAGPTAIEWRRCPWIHDAQPLELNADAECAELEVPLDWSDPASRRIVVDVRRLPPPRFAEPTAELFLLNGGPGASAATYERLAIALSNEWETVRFVLLDARGAGRSTRLGCSAERADTPGGVAIAEEEWPACLEELESTWGDDLAHFDTTSAARDLLDVASRLRESGVRQVVLGASYGTYWVHRALQIDPDAFDGVVLDAVVPADDPQLAYIDRWHDEVTRELLALCDEDATCAEKLGGDALGLTEALLERILEDGHCTEMGGEGATPEELHEIVRVLFGALISDTRARAAIPATVYRLDRCTDADVEALNHLIELLFGGDDAEAPGLFSFALAHHVTLSEMWGDPPPSLDELQTIADEALALKNIGVSFGSRYESWPRYAPDELHGGVADTDAPMLLMNGSLDPQTPLDEALRFGASFDGAHQTFVTFPEVSHAALSQSPMVGGGLTCGARIVEQFVRDPEATLDTACTAEIDTRDFTLTPRFAQVLFGTSDLWE